MGHDALGPPRFLAIDLFCGAGGVTCGLIQAGGYVIAGIDYDSRCEETYRSNNHNRTGDGAQPHFLCYDLFPATEAHPTGQHTTALAHLATLVPPWRQRYPDVPLLMSVCAPCQSFTALGMTGIPHADKGVERRRDRGLLQQALAVITQCTPELVFAENVPRIMTPNYGGVWQAFQGGLDAAGYVTGSAIVNTAHFGIPQSRLRAVLLAVRAPRIRPGFYEDLFRTRLTIPTQDPAARRVTVREALQHFPPLEAGGRHPTIPNHVARALSDLNLQRIAQAQPGELNAYMRVDGPAGDLRRRARRLAEEDGIEDDGADEECFHTVYTRMHPDRPAPTLTTACTAFNAGPYGHYDMAQLRAISVREAATLQSFPENYVFPQQVGTASRMVGNAVPPRLAMFCAHYLLETIAEKTL